MEPLGTRHAKELLHSLNQERNFPLTSEQEGFVLSHCRTPASRLPLYLTVLIDELAHSAGGRVLDTKLDMCLQHGDTVEIYRCVLGSLEDKYEDSRCRGLVKRVSHLKILCFNSLLVLQTNEDIKMLYSQIFCIVYLLSEGYYGDLEIN